jgi:hypothetical protein
VFLVGYRCAYRSGGVVLSNEHDAFRPVTAADYLELDDGSPDFEALRRCFEGMAHRDGQG